MTPTFPLGGEYRTFAFTAVQHQDDSVTGEAQLKARRTQGDVVIHADLDCLRIVGNTATMSGVVKRSTGTPIAPEGRPVIFTVQE
ncbi:MAG: hypothetical protein LC808_33485, partial [Actinobacteria bacterium]|nr:hypothetical protein [Actinomycetota bacterium]